MEDTMASAVASIFGSWLICKRIFYLTIVLLTLSEEVYLVEPLLVLLRWLHSPSHKYPLSILLICNI